VDIQVALSMIWLGKAGSALRRHGVEGLASGFAQGDRSLSFPA
jgi:hypothetical protein